MTRRKPRSNKFSSSPSKSLTRLTYASKISQSSWNNQIKTETPTPSGAIKSHNASNFSEDFPALPSSSKTNVNQDGNKFHVKSPAVIVKYEEGSCAKTCWRDVLVNKKNETLVAASQVKSESVVQLDSYLCKDKKKRSSSRNPSLSSECKKKDGVQPTEAWKDVPIVPVPNKWRPAITKPKTNELWNVLDAKSKSQKKEGKTSLSQRGKVSISSDAHSSEMKGFQKIFCKANGNRGDASCINKPGAQNLSRNENTPLYTWSNKQIDKIKNEPSSERVNTKHSFIKREMAVKSDICKSEGKYKKNDKILSENHSKTHVTASGDTLKQQCEYAPSNPKSSHKKFAKEENCPDETMVSVAAHKKKQKKRLSKVKRQAAMYSGKVVVVPAEVSEKLAGLKPSDDQKQVFKELVDVNSISEFPELTAVNSFKKHFDKKEKLETKEPIVEKLPQFGPKINFADGNEAAKEIEIKLLNGSNPEGICVKVDVSLINTQDKENAKSARLPLQPSSPEKCEVKENLKVKICPRDPVSLADIFATSAPKQKEKKKKSDVDSKPVTKKSSSQIINVLDSSGPVVKRGKEREKPKAKKTTHLKKIILKEREQRKEKLKNLVKAAEQYLKAQPNISVKEACEGAKKNSKDKLYLSDEKHDESKEFILDSTCDFIPVEDIFLKLRENRNESSLISRDENSNVSCNDEKHVDIKTECSERSSNETFFEHVSDRANDLLPENFRDEKSHSQVDLKNSTSILPVAHNNDKREIEFEESCKTDPFLKADKSELSSTDTNVSIEQYNKRNYEEGINCIQNGDVSHGEHNLINEIPKGIEIWKEITSNSCEICKDLFLKKSGYSIDRNSDANDCETNAFVNNLTEDDRKKAIKIVMHTKNFREYCNHLLSKKLDECVQQLLEDLVRFQDRMHQKDPVKAHIKRRLVYGLKEVTKKCKLKKLKCIIVAPNVENIQSEGGLNDTLENLIRIAGEYHVPCIFALERKQLGKMCKKPVPVSCVGVFNYDGSEISFKNILELHEESIKDYKELYALIQKNINNTDVVNLIQAQETAPGSLLGNRMKVLRSILMRKKDGSSKSEVSLEYEKFIREYMIKI